MIKQNAIGIKHEWDALEREAACVPFLLRTKEINPGTAVYSKYVLGRYLKELFEIPGRLWLVAAVQWSSDSWTMQTGPAIVFVAFEARAEPAVWLIITVTVLEKIFP